MYSELLLEGPFCLENGRPLLKTRQGTILAYVFPRLRRKGNDTAYTAPTQPLHRRNSNRRKVVIRVAFSPLSRIAVTSKSEALGWVDVTRLRGSEATSFDNELIGAHRWISKLKVSWPSVLAIITIRPHIAQRERPSTLIAGVGAWPRTQSP
jgi:hypothetical protein